MKSIIFTDKFAPHPGGTAIIYYNWVRHIPQRQMAVVTCTVPGREHRSLDRDLKAPVYRVPFIDIPKLRMPLCWLLIFLATPFAVLRERPTVFHAGQPLETGWIAWFWAQVCRKPYILHCFGDEIPFYWNSRWVGRIMRFLSRRADHITVISNYSAAKLHELGLAPERISIIYPGVEWPATACSHNCISTQHASTRKKTILTVGRLVLRKGHDRVIEALPNVLERVSDVEYVIVGGGTEEQRLRNLAKAVGVEAAVTFVGSVPHDVVQRYYEAADVFVHPNRQLENGDVEGFGIVFLEANACGLPVIGGNSGGTPDAIRHGITGFLVDPNSSAEIGDRIVELLQNDAMRKRMGEEGRKWAAQFKWSHAAELIDKLSETVSRSHSRGRTP